MKDVLALFQVALGFEVNTAQFTAAKKSIADYEAAVKSAEKRIEDARWAGAKSEQEIAKLTMETNLKEARAALAAAEQKEKTEQEAARKREARHKDFTAAMSKLTLAATAMATAVSYATTRVAAAFDHLGFVSQRTGASVQSLNSLGYAFKQVGGSSQQAVGAVESFAKAIRENSGIKSYVQGLGVDMTADTAQQLLQTVEKLNKHPYDVGLREAALAGISEEDYHLMTRQLSKIKEYRTEYDATTKALGIDSGKAAEASMAFQRTLTRLQATVSALSDKLLISLAPAMERILKGFNDWIAADPGKVDEILTGISNAAIWLATKFGDLLKLFTGSNGDEFMKKWDAFGAKIKLFADNVDRIANGIEKIAKFLEWATGTKTILGKPERTAELLNQMRRDRGDTDVPDVVVTPGATAGPRQDNRKWWERHAPTWLGGRPDPNAHSDDRGGVYGRVRHALRSRSAGAEPGDGVETPNENGMVTVRGHRYRAGAGTEQGRSRVASWLDFAQRPTDQGGLGLPSDKARAIVAGLQGESSANLNPNSQGDYRNGSPTAFGTAQWRLDRADGLRRTAAEMGTSWNDMKAQQAWMRKEMLEGRYRGVYDSIKGAANGEAALREYINRYENPADHAGAYAFRKPYLDTLRRQGDQKPIQVNAPKIEIKRPEGSSAGSTGGFPHRMDPGGFDVNAIMQPAPHPAHTVNNNQSSRSVHQTFNQNTTINGSENPRQAARIMESAFGNMHSLALQNAQSATV